ncbi:MAG: hypothetical protein WC516_06190 [Patescibacteria group bacterium]|jgi:hypothetical protein
MYETIDIEFIINNTLKNNVYLFSIDSNDSGKIEQESVVKIVNQEYAYKEE